MRARLLESSYFIIQTKVTSLFLSFALAKPLCSQVYIASFLQGLYRRTWLSVKRGPLTETPSHTRSLLSNPFMHWPGGIFSLAADPFGFLQLLKSFLCAVLCRQALMPVDSPSLTPTGDVH